MTKIEYSKEKVQIKKYLIVAFIFMLLFGALYLNVTQNGYPESNIEICIFIGLMVICLIAMIILNRKDMRYFKEIRENGAKLNGEIIGINRIKGELYTSKNKVRHRIYYTFTIKFIDPNTGKDAVIESIKTDKDYEQTGTKCKFSLYQGEALVTDAEVKISKREWTKGDFIAIAVGILIAIVIVFKP